MPKKPLGIATEQDCEPRLLQRYTQQKARLPGREPAGSHFAQDAQPHPSSAKALRDVIRPVTNRAAPSVASPRVVRLCQNKLACEACDGKQEHRVREPRIRVSGELSTRDRRMRAQATVLCPHWFRFSRIASVIGVIVIAPTRGPTQR